MESWHHGMKRRKLPSKVDLRPEFYRRLCSAPEEIRNIVAKGQGRQACCVSFTHMNTHIFLGTWGNGSVRFLHCICKMLDGGIRSGLGTTTLTGIRAEKGWWTCEEDLWISNVNLNTSEFEDWKSIPRQAWEDAKRKRTRKNRVLLNSEFNTIINLGGQRYHLVTKSERQVFEKDKQIDILVMDRDFDTVAWAQIRAYVDQKKIVVEDLFVKPESRRMGIGSELLKRVEYLASFDKVFREVSHEITVPIPNVDIWLPIRHQTVKEFYAKNGYSWNNKKTVPGREYSVFTVSKKVSCTKIPKNAGSITGIGVWLVRHLRYMLRHREPIEGPCVSHLRVFNSDFMDAWISVDRS